MLIMYATKLEIDLCNFLAIWAVISILLDTQSNELQYVKTLQQVVDNYYDRHPTEVMIKLEHQITDIMNAMYDSVTNDNFDSISDDTDRVSGAVDNDYDKNDNDQMPYDNDNDQMPYNNDNDQMPYDIQTSRQNIQLFTHKENIYTETPLATHIYSIMISIIKTCLRLKTNILHNYNKSYKTHTGTYMIQ